MINTKGIHHITAISSDPQKTYDFYAKLLGLRFVKKTVNFDAPDTYHFYFGDTTGTPGTILTFFPFVNAGTGSRGTSQITTIYLGVSKEALGFWLQRFILHNVKHENIKEKICHSVLKFYDPDGLQLELVGLSGAPPTTPWTTTDIPVDKAITCIFGAELSVDNYEKTANILKIMGYEFLEKDGNHYRYYNSSATHGDVIDLFAMPEWPNGRISAGTTHHIAFRIPNLQQEKEIRELLVFTGLNPTDVIDRNYFKSIYFREPNGITFEIATDEPGFLIDEKQENLGENLMLPPQYEHARKHIVKILPDLHTKTHSYGTSDPLDLFVHQYTDNGTDKTLLLLHGTGGNENSLLPLIGSNTDFNILALRGNILEKAIYNRFFKRFEDGKFDIENINEEVSKLDDFLSAASKTYNFKKNKVIPLGYSNGANFALAYIFTFPAEFNSGIFLHPMIPFIPKKLDFTQFEGLITFGESDENSTKKEISTLQELFENTKSTVIFKEYPGGHEISFEEAEDIRKFLNTIKN